MIKRYVYIDVFVVSYLNYFKSVHSMKRYCLSVNLYVASQKLLNGLQQDLLLEYTMKVSVQFFFVLSIYERLVYRELKSKLVRVYKKIAC
jgi:hypothetical protein